MAASGSDESLKQHLTRGRTWWRLLFMILFGVLFNVAAWVMGIIALFQFLHTLFTGAPNRRVLGFSTSLGTYIGQLVDYLIYQTESKPFPFDDWPAPAAPQPPDTPTPPVNP